MMENNCIIKFVDGSRVVIRNIDTYKVNMENGLVTVEVGGVKNFFNFNHMQYICTESCLDEEEA